MPATAKILPSLYNIEKYQVAKMSKLKFFCSAMKNHHHSCCNQDQVDQDGVFGKNIQKDDLFKIENERFQNSNQGGRLEKSGRGAVEKNLSETDPFLIEWKCLS